MGLPVGTRIWIAAGVTDMRCGFQSRSAKKQTALEDNPFGAHVFVFRGRRGDPLACRFSRVLPSFHGHRGFQKSANACRKLGIPYRCAVAMP
ncbi:IS66 family insertion sequence element accessory protein TnpB [Paraburkholderia xenovorans]|uniref:IS66 family insertion sequence element accessory protein TnpB n=1 Tax=Paraburkholderia xenovorans TaxID=36873 RepID=UPI0038B92A98